MTGREALFGRVYELTLHKVYAYFTACFGGQTAEDLSQQVFGKLWGYLCRPDFGGAAAPEPDSWQAWMFRLAVNEKNDFLRAKQRRGEPAEYEDALQNEVRETDGTDRLAVRGALDSLPREQREILTMKSIGLSSAETGQLLGISDSAARSRLAAARKAFAMKLRENGVSCDG